MAAVFEQVFNSCKTGDAFDLIALGEVRQVPGLEKPGEIFRLLHHQKGPAKIFQISHPSLFDGRIQAVEVLLDPCHCLAS